MRVRTRPQVKSIRTKGQAKCGVCLGLIKEGLPSVSCTCENRYHNSCATRTRDCPACGKRLRFTKQKPRVVDSEEPRVSPGQLSKKDKLFLLEERFILGEITERTYLSLRDEVSKAAETAMFCNVCGRRLIDGETCDCMVPDREFQCPECGSTISDEDAFCRRCGVVFSTDLPVDLFQCTECGRIVTGEETACECGALLVGEDNVICPGCGAEAPESALACPVCGRPFVEEISECPACGRRVDRDALHCMCGVVFSDMVGGVECSECGEEVDFWDRFCPECGARFADEPALEGRLERRVRS